MKKITYLFSLIGLLSFFSSCNSDNDQTVSGQKIYDEQGLLMTLEWNTGSGSEQAKFDADLDMSVEFQAKDILYSDWTNSFETLELLDFYQNETYYVKAHYIDGIKTATYTLYVRGLTDTLANDVRQFRGQMNLSEVGVTKTAVVITKDGNQYILR